VTHNRQELPKTGLQWMVFFISTRTPMTSPPQTKTVDGGNGMS
jgi:hypothetical protein